MSRIAVGEAVTFIVALMVVGEATFRTQAVFAGSAAVIGYEALCTIVTAMTRITVGITATISADVIVRSAFNAALTICTDRCAIRCRRAVHAERAAGGCVIVGMTQTVRTGVIVFKAGRHALTIDTSRRTIVWDGAFSTGRTAVFDVVSSKTTQPAAIDFAQMFTGFTSRCADAAGAGRVTTLRIFAGQTSRTAVFRVVVCAAGVAAEMISAVADSAAVAADAVGVAVITGGTVRTRKSAEGRIVIGEAQSAAIMVSGDTGCDTFIADTAHDAVGGSLRAFDALVTATVDVSAFDTLVTYADIGGFTLEVAVVIAGCRFHETNGCRMRWLRAGIAVTAAVFRLVVAAAFTAAEVAALGAEFEALIVNTDCFSI